MNRKQLVDAVYALSGPVLLENRLAKQNWICEITHGYYLLSLGVQPKKRMQTLLG